MMLVYRVELGFSYLKKDCSKTYYSERQGPYTTYYDGMSIKNGYKPYHVEYDSVNCPEPEDDGLEHTHDVIYGFKSKEQLLDWFVDDVLGLHGAGFQVSTYLVPDEDVTIGGKQLQFVPDDAILVSMKSIIEVVEEY